MKSPVITVVGSINMDLIISTNRRPKVGETVIGNNFYMKPGGKGANQAVAASRLGASVNMIGRIGEDLFGKSLMDTLKKESIFLDGLEPVTGVSSGVASIVLSEKDNNIIIYPGANQYVTPEYVHRHINLIRGSDIVLTQLEIPLETVQEVGKICKSYHIPFLLNPAPAQKLQKGIVESCSYVTPNEIELEFLKQSSSDLPADFYNKLVVTEGGRGSYYFDKEEIKRVPSYGVDVVDTTGAGDCFNAAFAYSISTQKDKQKACQFANSAAALSIQKVGAQEGMPTKAEIDRFLQGEQNE